MDAVSSPRFFMPPTSAIAEPLSWQELESLAAPVAEETEGATNAQARLRLFGQAPSQVVVTLYRDHHAWCPYCQKVWLWLEFKRIPYRIRKVTMRCYGRKEPWFLKLVPSGMLPALELEGRLITESDEILLALETRFGPLGLGMTTPEAMRLRQLERLLFQAWCLWLCRPGLGEAADQRAMQQFRTIARRFEQELNRSSGPWLDPNAPGTVDLVFVPYVERMNASLAYYKGYRLRREHPAIDRWFRALESLDTYRGTQSDMHTHVHDLPPQMGGCWSNGSEAAHLLAERINRGEGMGEEEASWGDEDGSHQAAIALQRVLRHRQRLLGLNPIGSDGFDQPLRCALTHLVTGRTPRPTQGTAKALRHLRDRISVPRDMPLPAGRLLRRALEFTAAQDSPEQPAGLPTRDRFDQDPEPFMTGS